MHTHSGANSIVLTWNKLPLECKTPKTTHIQPSLLHLKAEELQET